MAKRFASFAEFYPYYLSEHREPTCRRLHFVGTTIVIALVVVSLVTRNAWWLVGAPIAGYGFAWVGHFFFEHNRPATFSHPGYSLLGDFMMWKDIATGRLERRVPPA